MALDATAHLATVPGRLPQTKLVQVYGLSETGFLTGLQDQEHPDACK